MECGSDGSGTAADSPTANNDIATDAEEAAAGSERVSVVVQGGTEDTSDSARNMCRPVQKQQHERCE